LNKRLGSKELKMVYDDGSKYTRTCRCDLGGEICTLDDEILQLAGWACLIEDHYSQVRGIYTPMDIEWKDGITGKLFIVQAQRNGTIPA